MFNLFSTKPKPKKILFIEDEHDIIRLYQSFFNSLKDEYSVVFATSKEEVIKNFHDSDMIVSDYHLDGMKLSFKEVRAMCAKEEKPLLLITGDIAPMYKYQLSKPIRMSALKKTIDKMIAENIVCPAASETKKTDVKAS